MILTGEPSGDFHAGPLIRALKSMAPGTRITGIGGPAMTAEGADLFFDIDRLSAMGLIQVARQFSSIKAAFNAFRHRLRTDPPDLVIFIDYPGFNLKAATHLKAKTDIPTLYYIAPKVWAWNAARLDKIKACMDHVALILPFEPPIYKKKGIPATYVGNPLVDEYPFVPAGTGQGAKGSGPVIGLLPGSRSSEVLSLLPVMLEAATRLQIFHPDVSFYISAASCARKAQIHKILTCHPALDHCRVVAGRPRPVFETADMVIAASGTVTLEAALCQVPTVIIYKVSALTYALGRLLIKVKYAGLANLIAGRQVMPELLQHEASGGKIHREAERMLDTLDTHIRNLADVRLRLGPAGAPNRTARIALGLIRGRPLPGCPDFSHNRYLTNHDKSD